MTVSNFNFFDNIPLFIFGLAFTVVFIMFVDGALILFLSRDIERADRGKRTLISSFYGFLAILIVSSVFLLVTWILNKGQEPKPGQVAGEFPVSPIGTNFPPSPQIIKIGEFYFNGPFLLKDNDEIINHMSVFSILCKSNENYDIIYIGETEKMIQLSKHSKAKCWQENCDNQKNLYVAILWTPKENYESGVRREMKKSLEKELSPLCFEEE
ncbi:MAG: hypothetical protein A2V72_02070 [Candidatus Nealsonbacteria bacterium RBG_13_37_56]|uniref:Uncharacterized protein n=1 Tax=Candidatus Nealsonbacteria bacterium RBG_13_37_56 TaxID=1801661 RepID=A0A1G2DXU8_9BACT|nr:MAG: hypothetical protein A2V72_02070 [Candidatus Nealsonbacteria bacterium RBG_13_37_56]